MGTRRRCRSSPRCAEPRVRFGEAVVFPNLVPYAQHAAVAIFTGEHWLDLDGFTPQRIEKDLVALLA